MWNNLHAECSLWCLSATVKVWKQYRWPLTEKYFNKYVNIYIVGFPASWEQIRWLIYVEIELSLKSIKWKRCRWRLMAMSTTWLNPEQRWPGSGLHSRKNSRVRQKVLGDYSSGSTHLRRKCRWTQRLGCPEEVLIIFLFHPSLWQYLGILHWVCLLPVGGPSVFCSFVLVLFFWKCHGVRWESQWPQCKWHYNELKVRPQSGSGLLALLDKTSSCFPPASGYSFLWNWK